MYRFNTPTNGPSFDFGQLVVSGMLGGDTAAQIAFSHDGSRVEFRCGASLTTTPVWSEWVSYSTTTPPQEFNLPLAEGVSGLAKYSKDQFGRVQLRGWITGATANSVVATLPSGFRLASEAHFIQAISSSTQNGIARVVVRTDGTIYVELPQDGTLASGLSLQLSFAAAS